MMHVLRADPPDFLRQRKKQQRLARRGGLQGVIAGPPATIAA
jgi:hypothetical protein